MTAGTMTITFHAHCVAVEDMGDFWLVGLADERLGTRQYLMLQRAREHDEQDVALGMDTYHVERDDQRWSCYGGVERFELHRDRVVVRFTTSGATCLRAEGMEISFSVSDGRFDELASGLQRIFRGTECLAIG